MTSDIKKGVILSTSTKHIHNLLNALLIRPMNQQVHLGCYTQNQDEHAAPNRKAYNKFLISSSNINYSLLIFISEYLLTNPTS